MKKRSILIITILCLLMIWQVTANGDGSHDDGDEGHDNAIATAEDSTGMDHSMHGESSLRHQFSMILPFSHLAEGHWFAGIMLIIMWVALVYVIYDLTQKKK